MQNAATAITADTHTKNKHAIFFIDLNSAAFSFNIIYKFLSNKTHIFDAGLAAGLRLVAKVSLVYILLAFIIVIYV